ncbi:MAG TPA: ATP-binding cassette domain-containing protein [Deltaproteobacteria bacterium]|nr:ATP-binding cassette domain-containing protein [Deltaproteobacteria bacterium]HQI01233.1 ATP-binding cassette domain-containing protein [Deltaproteobacteria bacterium]HQJ08937.1 ATP-binding cassette domain-containing protein [Deltaproteobacteria bacterium]
MELDVRIKKKLKHFDLDVSFSCAEGRLLAIVGPSGAGKTTIIRIIAGLDRPDAGFISCRDTVWADMSAGINVPTRKRGIGYVFQEFTLFPNLSVYKNVAFAARNRDTVEYLLKMFDIWHLCESRPHLISGGERQRCAICQALARDPKVLLMDEPFSALDALSRRKLREMMKSIKSELHIPIIHVTHDIREALFIADDIMPVVQGRVEQKWVMHFMLTARDFDRARCSPTRAEKRRDEEEDIELSIKAKEYMK